MKNKSFDDNFDLLMKGIDKSKNRLVTITDKSGHTKRVWKHIETADEKEAGKNAGKSYEKTGKRHQSHSGFNSGDAVTFIAGGKELKGTFRHVNESKHSTVAVVRGEDNKLYERSLNKISKVEKSGQDIKTSETKKLVTTTALGDKVLSNQKNKDGLDVFRNIVKTAKDLNHAYELISKIKNVSKETSSQFRKLYDPESKLTPKQAFESFYNHVKGISDKIPDNVSKYLDVYTRIGNLEKTLTKNNVNDKLRTELEKKIKVLQIQEKNYAVKISKDEYEKFIPSEINQNWQDFKDAYSIKDDNVNKTTLHIETQKLDKKKNPNFGGKKEDNFTDVVDKTSWQRGDSVSYIDKNGKEKFGRVVKVDKEMNMTTIRQANGMTDTVSNKKVKL